MFGIFQKIMGKEPDYTALIAAGAMIIDVRSPEEFATGHIGSSTNIPLNAIGAKARELAKNGKPVITVCRSGNRSSKAKSILTAAGVEAYNGGAWNSLAAKCKL